MKILVTGAGGQLGSTLAAAFADRAEVLPLDRRALDVADPVAVARTVLDAKPDAIVNCAAYNLVDAAEDHPIEAINTNAFAVQALAEAAGRTGAVLVHYSTDFVFDGTGDRPYTENDRPRPQSVYAASKLLGEWFAADAPRWYVLRVESLFGGLRQTSSVDRILDALRHARPARVFTDRTVTPSYVQDVVAATWRLLHDDVPPGLYHCVNSEVTTWFELAQEIAGVLQVAPDLVPVRVADVPMKAKRPRYAALSNAKLAAAGLVMPSWRDALRRYVTGQSGMGDWRFGIAE